MNTTKTFLSVFSKPTWRRIAVSFALFIIPVLAFTKLAIEVKDNDTLPFDDAVLRSINAHASPDLNTLAVILTQFGGPIGVIVLTLGAASLLWVRKEHSKAAVLFSGVAGSAALNLLIKSLFQRDRPHLWERLVTENSYSFPSGHAMASSALAISLMVVFWPTRWRWVVIALAGSYMLVIAFTRLYLGVHYPTDVLAGWLVSAAWIAVLVSVIGYRHQFRPKRTK